MKNKEVKKKKLCPVCKTMVFEDVYEKHIIFCKWYHEDKKEV